MASTYTVTQMNSYIKNMFRQDFVLNRISVRGEISNCKYHTSGHIYFTLKDDGGTLSCVMFASNAGNLDFRIENGMQVVVSGRIDVYERDGKYQLYALSMEQDGIGDLYKRFEELKARFCEMGYFEEQYKRKIPFFAKKIGIVTASTGAAIHDICNIAYRRNPYVELILYPAIVQGADAAESIVKGIEVLDTMHPDVIIVGRGGGSIEDLWAFNEEIVAEAIFNAGTPVISAVGHETDFTIADFVADLRAPTPSAAAELAVAELAVVEDRIKRYREALDSAIYKKTDDLRYMLETYALRLKILSPSAQINEKRHACVQLADRLNNVMLNIFKNKRHMLEVYAYRLHGLSPLDKLSQGYAFVSDEDGSRISSVKTIDVNKDLFIHLKDGSLKAKVTEVIDGKITDS